MSEELNNQSETEVPEEVLDSIDETAIDETAVDETESVHRDEEFERLREKSMRSSTAYSEMEEPSGSSSGLTPSQRLIIAFLVLLNILVIGFGILVITGRFSL